ncbi:hypothetical protein SAMN04489764_2098 [Thermostaphylospora chromogena]|mgnify:CR=1 FL=1|uniref:Uncharacterized protein n=2 Tax=Thermostaphylospora chromogena TaxID=35622 RepID=A0A1H1DP29_9ACTN|nr:hypothetical protein SAMN04489764_2098 [Thermostaphylospora chromogena]
MIRRRAIESLNSLQPDDEPQHHDGDDEWLPMSGLILEEPEDVIRVWHINRADIPRPSTPKKRDFIHQPAVSSRQGELFDATEFLPAAHRDRKNHLILHWTVREHSITRFDLVRPIGTSENQVNIDWRVSLLPQYTG